MPRALLARLLALGCAALLAGVPQWGTAATAQVSIEVPQGKVKSVRLRHLPRGTLVGIAISASGRLGVELVSAAQLKAGKPRSLFRAVLERKLSFKVAIPESDDYYLVLDNRRGASPISVTATIQAVRGRKSPRAPTAPKRDGALEQTRAASSSQV